MAPPHFTEGETTWLSLVVVAAWAGASGCISCLSLFQCALPSGNSPNQLFQEMGNPHPLAEAVLYPNLLPSVILWYLTLSARDTDYHLLLLNREVSERSHTRENPDALPPQTTWTSCEKRRASLESTGPLLARRQDGIWSHMLYYGR